MSKRNLQSKLDREDLTPSDVAHWVVKFQYDFNERDLTPLDAVKRALDKVREGHLWEVYHVRSSLQWSVHLGRDEVVETVAPLRTEELNVRLHEVMPLSDLVDRLRRVGHVWLKNDDLLLLEELIRRAQIAERNPPVR